MITLAELRTAIESAWDIDTSFCADEWSAAIPARGQCVPTALVVQHYLGGTLRKYDTLYKGRPETHYTNLLPHGDEVDLTGGQYPDGQDMVASEINLHGYSDVIAKMMHEPKTVAAYELLLMRVERMLLPKP